METTALNLGSQIATATLNLAQDQLRSEGQAVLQLIESAAAQPANTAPQASSALGSIINITV